MNELKQWIKPTFLKKIRAVAGDFLSNCGVFRKLAYPALAEIRARTG